MPEFYEFFAGGGMARLGLGPTWRCLFANDISPKKAAAYRTHFDGAPELKVSDVAMLSLADLPSVADLVWASFPCQDLSLAGSRGGLTAKRSGAFWPFWRLMADLGSQGRAPRLMVLENVCGAISSHAGQDFLAIMEVLSQAGYQSGALVIDAAHFLPQSRPRLFILGVSAGQTIPQTLRSVAPDALWHPAILRERVEQLPLAIRHQWVWWRLPPPPPRTITLSDVLEQEPCGLNWHTADETCYLLSLMTEVHLAKVAAARKLRRRVVGGVYKRIRHGQQRAEVRFDDLAGCLRTPTGGSSRQILLMVEGERIRSRLLSAREAARLMGLPEHYGLPERYNEAYHLAGDGVAVPVVRYLAMHLLEPLAVIEKPVAKRQAA